MIVPASSGSQTPLPGSSGFLEVSGAFKAFGDSAVLKGVDLSVGQGEFVSLLGPSGCGKTTLLRMIAGLLAADRGGIRLAGKDIAALPPHKRDVSVVFQSYALFPHLTVAENVAFGLRARGASQTDIDRTVRRFLELVHIAEMSERSVRALSGGQQQRVAIARALVHEPRLLVCDEPTSALDAENGRITMELIERIAVQPDRAVIVVTHDSRVYAFADRIASMEDGRIESVSAGPHAAEVA